MFMTKTKIETKTKTKTKAKAKTKTTVDPEFDNDIIFNDQYMRIGSKCYSR